MQTNQIEVLGKCEDFLEKQMIHLNPELNEFERRLYMSGCIETLHYFGTIDEDILQELLLTYGT